MAFPHHSCLAAGPLCVSLDAPCLCDASLGDRILVRAIRAEVGDSQHRPIPCCLEPLWRSNGADSFALEFRAQNGVPEPVFEWTGFMTGDRDGAIRYTMTGRALRAFVHSRIGLSVCHPPEHVGIDCIVEDSVGGLHEARMPDASSRDLVFDDVSALTMPMGGWQMELRLDGDVFETVMLPNGGLCTRCTPSAFPCPLEIQPGACIEQSITLRLRRLQ